MNTTVALFSLAKESNSTAMDNQTWFVPLDILQITCLALTILLSFTFLSIVALNKTCHTVPIMLVANSCLAVLLFAVTLVWTTILSLYNDLKQIQYEDSLCKLRAYVSYAACSELLYSFLLQAIYRYVIVVYPSRLFWQSARFQLFLVVSTWLAAFICTSPYILTGEIRYIVDDQICQMPYHLSIVVVYDALYIYVIPMNCIIVIYFKLIFFVRQMSRRMTQANTLARAQRELRMLRRIVVIVSTFLIFGVPYATFMFTGFARQQLPKYPFRIAFAFVDTSLFLFIIVLFQFTDPVRVSIIKGIRGRQNAVIQSVA